MPVDGLQKWAPDALQPRLSDPISIRDVSTPSPGWAESRSQTRPFWSVKSEIKRERVHRAPRLDSDGPHDDCVQLLQVSDEQEETMD